MVRELSGTDRWPVRWSVLSSGGDKEYIVAMNPDTGAWACSCPKWKFHKAPKAPCKHINQVRAKEPVDKTKTTPADEQQIRRQFQSNQPDRFTGQSQPPYFVIQTTRQIVFED